MEIILTKSEEKLLAMLLFHYRDDADNADGTIGLKSKSEIKVVNSILKKLNYVVGGEYE